MTEVVLVRVAGDRPRRALRAAEPALLALGHDLRTIEVPATGLPDLTERDKDTWEAFKHTPEPLLESWRVARHLERFTDPTDTLVIADDGGLGGIAALEAMAQPPGERRGVWTLAVDSEFLRWLSVAGTIDGVPEETAHVIDWEIAQYRHSDRVLALSEFAAHHVAALGVDAELLATALPPAGAAPARAPAVTIWLPEAVSRTSRTGVILRGLSAGAAAVTASTEDRDDGLWSGTTWEAIASPRATFGDRLVRKPQPAGPPDLVVLGDVTAVPGDDVAALRSDGVVVAVPAHGTAAALWPDAPVWSDEDELAALAAGEANPPSELPRVEPPVRSSDETRARRVSVGIPVFRDIRFLDEAVESVLAQTQPPVEVLLIDDGSQSPEVTEALAAWEQRSPIVRALAQDNRGVCEARNRMLAEMTGDAFVLVDADDALEPEFIERTATALRGDDRLSAVATWTRFFGEYDGIEAKPPFDARVGRRENPIVSTAVLVDMGVRDAGIRFAPDMAFLYCEDWYVWSCIVAAGGWIGLVPRPLVRHRTHLASGAYQRTPLALQIGKARATAPLHGAHPWRYPPVER